MVAAHDHFVEGTIRCYRGIDPRFLFVSSRHALPCRISAHRISCRSDFVGVILAGFLTSCLTRTRNKQCFIIPNPTEFDEDFRMVMLDEDVQAGMSFCSFRPHHLLVLSVHPKRPEMKTSLCVTEGTAANLRAYQNPKACSP